MNKRQAKKKKKLESSYVRKTLLKQKSTDKGNVIYDIPASKVREKEFQRMVRKANDRLRSLEKAGLYEESREYRMVSHYAYTDPDKSGKGWIYNVNPEKDTIRFTTKLPEKGLQYGKEREYLINTVRNFLRASTSTVTGTRRAMKKAYDTFMLNNEVKAKMTQEEYNNLWRIYHDMKLRDRLDNEGYNAFMTLMKNSDLYKMDNEKIRSALSYLENSEKISEAGKLDDVLENVKTEDNFTIDLAFK